MKLLASLLITAALAASAVSVLAQEAAPKAVPAKAAKPDLAKGEASFTAVCAACHGADGNSGTPVNPKLAQQHPEYTVKQLQEFKSGKRANAVMSGMAATLSDADMKNIAYWLASKTAKPGFAKDKELVALGERIYRGGIADRQRDRAGRCGRLALCYSDNKCVTSACVVFVQDNLPGRSLGNQEPRRVNHACGWKSLREDRQSNGKLICDVWLGVSCGRCVRQQLDPCPCIRNVHTLDGVSN